MMKASRGIEWRRDVRYNYLLLSILRLKLENTFCIQNKLTKNVFCSKIISSLSFLSISERGDFIMDIFPCI